MTRTRWLGVALAAATPWLGPVAWAQDPEVPEVPAGSPPAEAATQLQGPPTSLEILDAEVLPGERRTLWLSVSESFAGTPVETPVTVIAGTLPGPRLCLTGGVHGDELNGVEIVRRSLAQIRAQGLRGSVVGLPIANLAAFRRSSRYLPDRRDLNRFFPGRQFGSSASRIAHVIFEGVIRHCSGLVDFHTGSFHRVNLPQVRGDLRQPEVLAMAESFGSVLAVHHEGQIGTLRRAATDVGVPALTYEGGGPMRLERTEIERGVRGVMRLMAALDMTDEPIEPEGAPAVYWTSSWQRANDGGILNSEVTLGDQVQRGDVLGTVFDPVSNERGEIRAAISGRVIGMAVDQVVMPGFAAFHIGAESLPGGDPGSADNGPDPSLPDDDPVTGAPELEERPE